MRLEGDVLSWLTGTAIVSAVTFYIMQLFTSNDLLMFITLFVIMSLSIILLNYEFPEELNFKTGSIIAVICYSSMIMSSEFRSVESFAFTAILFSFIFLIGGFFGKIASHDKEKIINKYWFWMVILFLVVNISLAGYSFYDSQFGRMNYVSPQVIPTESIPITQVHTIGCSTDADCEPNKCIHHSCHTVQEETLSRLTESDWKNYWRVKSNSYWSLINDNGEYYLKNNGNEKLNFNDDIYNISFIEFKVNIEQGGVMINFNNDYSSDKKNFLEFGNEHIEITNYADEEYIVLGTLNLDLNTGVWHTIRMEIEEQVSVYLNDELVLSNITYERYNEDLLERKFSIEPNENPTIYIDDISVTSGAYEQIKVTS